MERKFTRRKFLKTLGIGMMLPTLLSFPKLEKAIIIGSPNGGVAHLAALLQAPFLTTSFELSFRHSPFDPDDLQAYLKIGKNLADIILDKSKDIQVINHYDPLHDRNLVKYVNRIRIRLLKIPSLYERFILRNLASGGKLILINCSYHWPQYKLNERSFFQIGGLGGISPEEYLKNWNLNFPLEERRESEWGCSEEFTFIQTGIPGFWLPFNTRDSLEFAKDFLKGKKFKKIYLTLLPSFAKSPDTPPLDCWVEATKRHGKLNLLGISPRLFPADPSAPFLLVSQMRRMRQKYRLFQPLYLSFFEFEKLLA